MDIKQCYETLDLNSDASIEDVKQAYRDMVNIWHPDRVSNNPRLKQKAEEKLKQINGAHEKLLSYLNSRPTGATDVEKASQRGSGEKNAAHDQAGGADPRAPDRPETRVKTGSGVLSTLWYHFSDLLRSLNDRLPSAGAGTRPEPYSSRSGRGYRQDKGTGGGRGAGRGRGMGRSGRGMGRGKGMGGGRGS